MIENSISAGQYLHARWAGHDTTSGQDQHWDALSAAQKEQWERLAGVIGVRPGAPLGISDRLSSPSADDEEPDRGWKPGDTPRPFFVRAADTLYHACAKAIRNGRIDARSEIGDAVLDYRDERDDMASRPIGS
jgi:hypothetical protein